LLLLLCCQGLQGVFLTRLLRTWMWKQMYQGLMALWDLRRG
jgi:hypothetical protein